MSIGEKEESLLSPTTRPSWWYFVSESRVVGQVVDVRKGGVGGIRTYPTKKTDLETRDDGRRGSGRLKSPLWIVTLTAPFHTNDLRGWSKKRFTQHGRGGGTHWILS